MVEDEIDKLVVEVSDTRSVVRCPACGHKTSKVHETRKVVVRDIPLGRPTALVWLQRRFECPNCGEHHTEDHREIEGKLIRRLARQLVRDSKYLTIRELARRHRLSWYLVMGLVRTWAVSVAATGGPCPVEQLRTLLDSPEVASLITELEATRWTGRPGYPIRATVGMALIKSLYVLPTWTRTVRLVTEHATLRAVLGDTPSVDACYRFTRKLREHRGALDSCIASVPASLRAQVPELGQHVAIDGSDLPAYANGQRYLYNHGPERKRFSDPDASWGHRSAISTRKGGGYFG